MKGLIKSFDEKGKFCVKFSMDSGENAVGLKGGNEGCCSS